MTVDFKPMLAATLEDVAKLAFPLYASPKLDGIRCIIRDGMALSRTLKPIPNEHVQRLIQPWMEGIDGELIVGEPWSHAVYRNTSSGVMSRDGEPYVRLFAFDLPHHEGGWLDRFEQLSATVRGVDPFVEVVEHRIIRTVEELDRFEVVQLSQGYEGVMLRAPHAPYKHGRSTLKEGWLLKLKRFSDAEATVIGVEELQHNHNAATRDELGRTKRSSHKQNKVAGAKLGALLCRTADGIEFAIGSGFTDAEKQQLWQVRDTLPGRIVKFKHFEHGAKDAPRHPVFLGFRDLIDL